MNTQQAKTKLEALQQELSNRINGIDNDFRQGRSADFSEQATETENDDVLRSLKLEAQHELSLVNLALNRLANGDYGVCEKCGEDILPARLEVLPFTTTCINCSE